MAADQFHSLVPFSFPSDSFDHGSGAGCFPASVAAEVVVGVLVDLWAQKIALASHSIFGLFDQNWAVPFFIFFYRWLVKFTLKCYKLFGKKKPKVKKLSNKTNKNNTKTGKVILIWGHSVKLGDLALANLLIWGFDPSSLLFAFFFLLRTPKPSLYKIKCTLINTTKSTEKSVKFIFTPSLAKVAFNFMLEFQLLELFFRKRLFRFQTFEGNFQKKP